VFDLAPNQRKPKRHPFQGPSGGNTARDKEFDVENAGFWRVHVSWYSLEGTKGFKSRIGS